MFIFNILLQFVHFESIWVSNCWLLKILNLLRIYLSHFGLFYHLHCFKHFVCYHLKSSFRFLHLLYFSIFFVNSSCEKEMPTFFDFRCQFLLYTSSFLGIKLRSVLSSYRWSWSWLSVLLLKLKRGRTKLLLLGCCLLCQGKLFNHLPLSIFASCICRFLKLLWN